MKFVCLGYLDEAKYAAMPPDEKRDMLEECFAYHEELRRNGHILGGEALDSARKAVTLRFNGEEVEATDGPYAETKEAIAGLVVLEARDMDHAVELLLKHPGVKMGPFEIRPTDDVIDQKYAEHRATAGSDAP